MKRAKIAICAVVMTLLIGMVPMTAFAATGLNGYETALLAEIRAKLATFTMTVAQRERCNSYIAQIETHLNNIELDSTQYAICVDNLGKLEGAVGGKDVTNVSILNELFASGSPLNTVLSNVAKALELTPVLNSSNGTITFTDKDGKPVDGVKPKIPGYEVTIDGLSFTINAPRSKYIATYVDGKTIPDDQLTITGGNTSTTVTFKTLSNGTHTISVYFNDGGYAVKTFTVSQTGTGTTTITPVKDKSYSISEIKSLPSNGGLRFTIEGSFDQYIATYVNGKDVPSNQLTIQKSANGKTIITLKQSYLKTLGGGTHIMYVSFAEGYSAQTTFALSGGGIILSTGGTIKQTGVPVGYLVFIVTAFMAIIASCAFAAKKKNLFAVHKAV